MSPLTDEDGLWLLGIARRSLESSVRGQAPPDVSGFSGALLENAGAFVTLRIGSALRGCIGQVEPRESLAVTVSECSASAALHDPRFPPVKPDELGEISIEVNVLSRPFEIRPEEIEIGRHGLIVSSPFARGLLLPEVAVEWNWDADRFLDETSRKAGLSEGAWRRGARIHAFTTQAFAEPRFRAAIPAGSSTHRAHHK